MNVTFDDILKLILDNLERKLNFFLKMEALFQEQGKLLQVADPNTDNILQNSKIRSQYIQKIKQTDQDLQELMMVYESEPALHSAEFKARKHNIESQMQTIHHHIQQLIETQLPIMKRYLDQTGSIIDSLQQKSQLNQAYQDSASIYKSGFYNSFELNA